MSNVDEAKFGGPGGTTGDCLQGKDLPKKQLAKIGGQYGTTDLQTVITLRSIGSDVNKGLPPSVLPLLDEAELGGGVMAESRGPCCTTGDCLEKLAKFGGPYGTTDLQTVVMLKSIGSEVNRDLLPPVLLLLDEAELGGRCHGQISWSMRYHRRSP